MNLKQAYWHAYINKYLDLLIINQYEISPLHQQHQWKPVVLPLSLVALIQASSLDKFQKKKSTLDEFRK